MVSCVVTLQMSEEWIDFRDPMYTECMVSGDVTLQIYEE